MINDSLGADTEYLRDLFGILAFGNQLKDFALPLILSPAGNGNEFTFSFETIEGKTYVIEYKDSLDNPNWHTLQSVPGDGSLLTISNSATAMPQRFFRLSVE